MHVTPVICARSIVFSLIAYRRNRRDGLCHRAILQQAESHKFQMLAVATALIVVFRRKANRRLEAIVPPGVVGVMWKDSWRDAAQPAHAADRLPHSAALRGRKQPRRVPSSVALVSGLLAE